ncbi:MAG: response regulator [Burkholderiales bacterium]
MRVLLAEDDAMIGDGVRRGLAQDGFAVDWVRDGRAAELALAENVHDLLLLDLGLPRRDGLDVLQSMRRRGDKRPVLVLTARDAVTDRVAGLDACADDYRTKPFELSELAARMRALLRRPLGRAAPRMALGALVLDPASHTVTLEGAALALSAREFALLDALLARPGAILSRADSASAAPSSVTVCDAGSSTNAPSAMRGAARPNWRRNSARIRAASSLNSNGFVR